MSLKSYYEAPSDEMFNEIKEKAIILWHKYDDDAGYVTEKIGRIKDLENVRDNALYMVAMFDPVNQGKLKSMLKPETVAMIEEKISE